MTCVAGRRWLLLFVVACVWLSVVRCSLLLFVVACGLFICSFVSSFVNWLVCLCVCSLCVVVVCSWFVAACCS